MKMVLIALSPLEMGETDGVVTNDLQM